MSDSHCPSTIQPRHYSYCPLVGSWMQLVMAFSHSVPFKVRKSHSSTMNLTDLGCVKSSTHLLFLAFMEMLSYYWAGEKCWLNSERLQNIFYSLLGITLMVSPSVVCTPLEMPIVSRDPTLTWGQHYFGTSSHTYA